LTTLLVASTGGHLKQLHRLHRRLVGIDGPFRWATFDTPQSRSLLEGEAVDFVRFVGGRDPANVLRNVPVADRILRRSELNAIVSTGSAVALPFFALGRARGLRCHYIESAARSDGPSKTARMISRIPGVYLYTQYPAWADHKWHYRGAVFDSFVPVDEPVVRPSRLRKVVVSLGTFKDYGFERLVRRLLAILPPDADVLWQTGDTDIRGLGIAGHHAIPERELAQAIRDAEVWAPLCWPSRSASAPFWFPGASATGSTSTTTRRRSPESSATVAWPCLSRPTTSRSTTSSPPRQCASRRCPPTRRSRLAARGRPPR
jgi:UDP-N-acetylglucosamine--N-acetylmuramyl-(pentapeptide) pyrophosphoryl-undecaprenol N-acetylglucosamine transferase